MFPQDEQFDTRDGSDMRRAGGMTMLDFFAATIAPAMWAEACQQFREEPDEDIPLLREVAEDSYALAEALLAEKARRDS